MSRNITEEEFAAGSELMTRIYGRPASGKFGQSPYLDETVGHLFANVWGRPGLSLRDRRLLVLGCTAMIGRADLIEIQVKGALKSGDFKKDELDEMMLQLTYYAGWGNSTAVVKGMQAAIASLVAETQST